MNPAPLVKKKSREEVEAVVQEERVHQNILLGNRNAPTTLLGNVLLMDHYVNKAVHAWAEESQITPALHQIRKITAIAVRCLEDHGGLNGVGQDRETVYRNARQNRPVPDHHVADLAEALMRLRSMVREAEDNARSLDRRPSVTGIVLDVVAHGIATMEIHGAPHREGL